MSTQTQQAVLDVLAKHAKCDVATLTPDRVLADTGINSLKFIMVLLEIEQVSGKKVMDINKIGQLKTVGDILALTQS
jgi:acyl carrier protein